MLVRYFNTRVHDYVTRWCPAPGRHTSMRPGRFDPQQQQQQQSVVRRGADPLEKSTFPIKLPARRGHVRQPRRPEHAIQTCAGWLYTYWVCTQRANRITPRTHVFLILCARSIAVHRLYCVHVVASKWCGKSNCFF